MVEYWSGALFDGWGIGDIRIEAITTPAGIHLDVRYHKSFSVGKVADPEDVRKCIMTIFKAKRIEIR